MDHPNIYTFKHSALPPIDDAIKGEIAEIDFNVSNLILKFQGHYRALSELRETLSDLLNSCDLNLQSIRIIPDGDGEDEDAPRAIDLTQVSLTEKQVVVSTAITSSVAIEMLADILECDIQDAAFQVRTIGQARFSELPPESIERIVEQLVEVSKQNPTGQMFAVET